MVVRTEVCNFSEMKIYPGHGTKVMTRDGSLLVALSHKTLSFLRRKTKGQVIRWTVVWRKLNKKFKAEKNKLKKKKKATDQVKGISGISKEEIQRRLNMTPQDIEAQRQKIQLELKQKLKAKQVPQKQLKKPKKK